MLLLLLLLLLNLNLLDNKFLETCQKIIVLFIYYDL